MHPAPTYLCALSANTTDDGVWVNAADLTAGEQILSLDGDYGTVERVVVVEDANQPMYNLTVDEAHTFYVGEGDWLVHNSGNCWKPGDDLDVPTSSGNPPSWDVVRERFWETEVAFRAGEYGPRNQYRMSELKLAPQMQVEVYVRVHSGLGGKPRQQPIVGQKSRP